MPAKRRKPKRRPGDNVDDWFVYFWTGTDYCHDLPFTTDEEARAAAPDAWRRLGATFLANPGHDPAGTIPWALRTLGEPR
jgi:hypothetical protein